MGRADDPRFETLFRWKHLENAFGPSPMWVADAGGDIVGLRVFMRWEFERDREVVRAVRAVDTATHPAFQGRGIFTRLTLAGLEELKAEGVEFVFNTPNSQSRPGYLKMGWHELGRPVVSIRPIRPIRPSRLFALRNARVAAHHWSEPLDVGQSITDLIDAGQDLEEAPTGATRLLRTRGGTAVWRWRYGLPDLWYRVIAAGDSAVVVVRVRRRGDAREAVLADWAPRGSGAAARRSARVVAAALDSRADYLLAVGPIPGGARSRRLGPVVTARPVAGIAPSGIDECDFCVGDLELF
jgi:GNAT superfamily N-acetyltransferase